MSRATVSVLMVCLGNICRSPTAEGVLRHKLAAAGLADRVRVDSAGTSGYHIGDPPDPRSCRHALRRGIDLSGLRARRLAAEDFDRFDLLLAMDDDNLADMRRLCPSGREDRLRMLLSFATAATGVREVPDPYAGGPDGFETVLDLVDEACDGLVAHLHARLQGTN
jgi:protein-tyrosine phosphatase